MAQQAGIDFVIRGTTSGATKAIDKLMNSLVKLNNTMENSQGLKNYRANMNAFQAGIKNFGKSLLKATGAGAMKGIKGLLSLSGWPPRNAIAGIKSYAKGLSKVANGFKRVLFYRAIRTAIKAITDGLKEGTENLYKWSQAMGGAANSAGQTFAQSMDSIATSMLYFKNSIGAAVAPLISALAPIIDMVVDKIVTLINLINQLFAKLTGASSWNRAIKKATQYGDAVSGAGEAAKEAMHYLAPFDELNVLPADNQGSSGGGGANQDYSGMFEEVSEFNEAIADFADSIKAKVQAADWQGLGELLGGKINDVVNMIDFAGAGAKVGTGINAWFTTKYWTLQTVNFQNIGSKIAEFLNNAIENIDFNVLGRLITQKWTIVGDFLIGAIETINWGQITSKLSDFIIGSFDQLSEWIQSVDWAEFGSTLWSSLKDAVEGIDFGGIASSLMTLLGSAIAGASQLVYNFVRDAIHDIWGYFMSFAQDENGDGKVAGGEILEGILKGIINGVKNIGTWIRENIFTPFINGFKSVFGIASPAKEMEEPGQMVAEGILAGILKPFKTIKAWVKEHIVEPLAAAIKEKIAEATDLVNIGLDIIDNMLSGIQDGWVLMKAWFSDNFVRGIAQFGIDAANGLLQPVENMINSVIDDINGITGDLPQWVKDKFGLGEIDHIDLKLVPDLDPPVGTFYNETKQRIEEESKKKPTDITAKAGVTSIDTNKISNPTIDSTAKFTAKQTAFTGGWSVNGNPMFGAVAKFTAKQTAFTGAWSVNGNPMFGAVAKFTSKQQAFTGAWSQNGAPMFGSIAKFNQKQTAFTGTWSQNGNPIFGSIAKFTAKQQAFTGDWSVNGAPMFGSIAKFTASQNGLGYTPSFNSVAYLDDWENGLNYKPRIEVDAYIDNMYDSNGYKYNASGGIFSGGQWHDIAGYASGGSPKSSQLFYARENGAPELVGTIGNQTAVLNNGQIVESVAFGVQKAIAGIRFHLTGMSSAQPTQTESGMDEESIYRAMVRALNDADVFPDTIDLDGDVVYRKMVNRNRQERMRLGVNPMMTA